MFTFLTSPAAAIKKGDDVMSRWWQRLEIGPGFEPQTWTSYDNLSMIRGHRHIDWKTHSSKQIK